MNLFHCLAICFIFFSSLVHAQETASVIDPNSGYTMVQVVQTNSLGVLTTLILETISPAAPPRSTSINTAPIGQVQTTLPGQTTNPYTALATGTVLGYSDWLTMVGTNTVPASSAGMPRWKLDRVWYGVLSSLAAGVLGGAWVVLA